MDLPRSGKARAVISFERVSVNFTAAEALTEIDLTVDPGALCVLVGPSGSGKSTLLRLANGLVRPSAGRVLVRGTDVADLDPAPLRRSIGYVIQSLGLFPHRTVAENIATVPRLLGWPKDKIAARVSAMLDLVHLGDAAFQDRAPSELSGGQAQRVGLARALAADPDILLMDEPFGAVDPIVRRDLRGELKRIHAETGKTILLVTHDPVEALDLATQIVVLRAGSVVAAGSPMDLTARNGDPFVRELFGGEALALRRLRFTQVGEVMQAPAGAGGPHVPEDATLREALGVMVETRSSRLTVVRPDGTAVGALPVEALVERHR
jgi:osmoprotectant transport system ATP-binding protein